MKKEAKKKPIEGK